MSIIGSIAAFKVFAWRGNTLYNDQDSWLPAQILWQNKKSQASLYQTQNNMMCNVLLTLAVSCPNNWPGSRDS